MKMRKKKIRSLALMLGAVVMLSAGCSRATINSQVADCLGTSGMYENNEPVESPKMRAERELKEIEEAKLAAVNETLTEAKNLADSYNYEAALAKLDELDEELSDEDQVIEAKIAYQQGQGKMVAYDGPIPHIFFHSLIVDTDRAFDGDDMEEGYNWWMTTADEFVKMMEGMYEKGYVLIDIHETVTKAEGEDGSTTYIKNNPMVPEGKIPFVLSIDDVNYYDYMLEDGFAKCLMLDENGDVKNLYIDAQGNEHVGDYDVVPLLDTFVKEHPDFSLRGAKGIVAETGYEGAFGYRVNDPESPTYEADQASVKEVAERLWETGWQIASHSYGHGHMNQMGYENVTADTDKWLEQIGSLVGETDILLYPYGEEVDPGDKMNYLKEKGFAFLCGVWGNQEFLSVEDGYVRQTRRNFDGYTLHFNPDSMRDFFNPEEVIDPARPAFE